MKKIRVWDLPLRLFHWTLAVLVVAAVVTQKIGGNATQWHFWIGYTILALLLFRLIWGMVGTRYARFADFFHGPGAILRYLRGEGRDHHGHNPLGSVSVFAMLAVLLTQAVTGLLANDDIASEGPLVKFITKDLSDRLTWVHKDINAYIIYALISLHVAAILYYAVRRRQNLVRAMITGDKHVDGDIPPARDTWTVRLGAVVVLIICVSIVAWIVTLKP